MHETDFAHAFVLKSHTVPDEEDTEPAKGRLQSANIAVLVRISSSYAEFHTIYCLSCDLVRPGVTRDCLRKLEA